MIFFENLTTKCQFNKSLSLLFLSLFAFDKYFVFFDVCVVFPGNVCAPLNRVIISMSNLRVNDLAFCQLFWRQILEASGSSNVNDFWFPSF